MRLYQLLFSLFTGLPAILKDPTFSSEINVPGSALTVPISCLAIPPPTLEELISCFDDYTVPKKTYDLGTYTAAQPSDAELAAWITAVSNLLAVDGTCAPSLLPNILQEIYNITLFNQADGRSFCVLSEVEATVNNYYKRGWGIMAVPATRAAVSRYIHISAPHPVYDNGTSRQAAAIFNATGAKSLFISGRHRNALTDPSCLGPTLKFNKTDAAHDINEPFFPANEAIRSWQNALDGCLTPSCAYIQVHRQTSCDDDNIILSAGIGHGRDSVTWYTTVDSPARRIRDQLRIAFPEWKNSLPSDSLLCDLTATKNVFGRLLNRVDRSLVCTPASDANFRNVTGQFVHMEQNDTVLASANYAGIARAINRAISTTCMPPMHMDLLSLLCVF